ncbi:histidine kinase [Nostoc linckia z18]|uniref:Circadian input-output histidine kinase CikA n=2 Tax=Nostoc linckia TaxID=92942 RepID=A0A9Q6EIM7_NOSLI|nr:PAS domain-containing protein [Nostoc linckia]PHK27171.1 histidine kinase [Nostoc linckia z15]PHK43884.1 histidine kinase [Nostoc linckia z16]PHJ58973.1 histidine kinase [Nostoc linckia z3]PHJ61819.1 histidine kinase [Nostoc linckia z1]PHJ63482.1 histidine kinase [Nostoc linckia z2]
MPGAEKSQNQLASDKLLYRQVNKESNYSLAVSKQEGTMLLLPDGTIQACNAAVESILEVTTEQFVGQNFLESKWQFVDENGSPLLRDIHPVMVALKTGKPCLNVMCGFYKPHDRLVWLLLSSQPLFQVTGTTPYAIVVTFSDITESKYLEAEDKCNCVEDTKKIYVEDFSERWDSQRLFQQIAGTLPGILYIYDVIEQRNSYVNYEITDFWGYTPEQIQAMGSELFTQLIHPDDLARLPSYLERFNSVAAGEVLSFEYRIRHANGEWRWFCSYDTVYGRTAEGLTHHLLGIAFDITNRRATEISLRQSNERFELAAAAVNSMIYDWEVHKNTVERTQGLTDVFGYSQQEAKPNLEWWQEHIHPEDLPMVNDEFITSMAIGNRYSIKYRVRHKDGRYLWVQDKGFAVRDANGQVVRVVGANTDITEQQAALHDRQQAETKLRESEERIRLATTAAEVGMWFWNITSNELIWTEKCKQLFGLSPEAEINFQIFLNCVHPEDHPIIEEAISNSIEQKLDSDIEYRSVWPDGSIHWIDARCRVFCDADGKPIKLMGTAQDITKRKQAENNLLQRETQLRRLVDSNIIGILFATPEYITDANEAFLEMVGYTREELLTFKVRRQDITPPEYHALDVQSMEQLLAVGVFSAYEKEYIRKDGSRIPILIGGAMVTRSPISWICFIIDLTPRKQLEKALRQQAEELKQANRNKDEFLAILSHELRSPLNPILGWSSLLRSRKFDENTTNRALETIERNTQLQIQLIDELLDVSRIIRGKLNLTFAPVNPLAVIEAALETVRLIAETKSIQIKTHFDTNVGKISGDFYRLQQVVGNLLSNAVKFTPTQGTVEVSLALTQDLTSQWAVIQVKDTGQGISPEFLPHVFEYFRQADSSTTRKFGGLGLGLAIVRHLVELHGGTAIADSPGIGQGAIFTVKLPLMKEMTPARETGGVGGATENFNFSILNGLRVLIVDDDADTREFVSFLLQQNGAVIAAVASATQALVTIAEKVPDLLISDLAMPEIDGYGLMKQIRAMPKHQGGEILAIALTAYVGESDRERVLKVGFDKHVAKPVKPLELLTSIADLLKEKS